MTYEYSTQGATLDFPNPYRIENQFLAVRGGLLLVASLVLLWLAREVSGAVTGTVGGAQAGPTITTSLALGLLLAGGIALALLAIINLAKMARQLRVFFGRGQPASLAPEIARGQAGTSAQARLLTDSLRQGAIGLSEPHGALNGVLYSLAKDLITAPAPLRAFLQVRFANAVAAAGLLLLFAVTQLISAEPNARALGAALYVALGAVLIVRSYLQGGTQPVSLGPVALVGLLAFAVVGTVFVGRLARQVPDLTWLNLPVIALVLLAASVAVETLGLLAGFHHVDPPPPASTAAEQVAVSFNADPNLLVQEIDRELQKRWTEAIPNRRYAWVMPAIELNAQAGNFAGTVLEESQPMPPKAVGRMDWSTCLAYPRYSRLALLDAIGLLLTAVGCGLWVALGLRLGLRPAGVSAAPALLTALPWSFLSLGGILVIVGGYGAQVAHGLWGRLDFESDLVWIELQGSYARARLDLGNQWTDRVRSGRDVVNVESMTLRAWVVRARSVLFDYRASTPGSRVLVGMAGHRDGARNWVQLVQAFAQAQSMAVVPTATADAQRIAHMQGLNALPPGVAHPLQALVGAGGPAAAAGGQGGGGAGRSGAAAGTALAGSSTPACRQCGQPLGAGARFCPHCGTPAVA